MEVRMKEIHEGRTAISTHYVDGAQTLASVPLNALQLARTVTKEIRNFIWLS